MSLVDDGDERKITVIRKDKATSSIIPSPFNHLCRKENNEFT
jgi:hypothetical protein